eukprot:4339498-Amphidinium_carterae.1
MTGGPTANLIWHCGAAKTPCGGHLRKKRHGSVAQDISTSAEIAQCQTNGKALQTVFRLFFDYLVFCYFLRFGNKIACHPRIPFTSVSLQEFGANESFEILNTLTASNVPVPSSHIRALVAHGTKDNVQNHQSSVLEWLRTTQLVGNRNSLETVLAKNDLKRTKLKDGPMTRERTIVCVE